MRWPSDIHRVLRNSPSLSPLALDAYGSLYHSISAPLVDALVTRSARQLKGLSKIPYRSPLNKVTVAVYTAPKSSCSAGPTAPRLGLPSTFRWRHSPENSVYPLFSTVTVNRSVFERSECSCCGECFRRSHHIFKPLSIFLNQRPTGIAFYFCNPNTWFKLHYPFVHNLLLY